MIETQAWNEFATAKVVKFMKKAEKMIIAKLKLEGLPKAELADLMKDLTETAIKELV